MTCLGRDAPHVLILSGRLCAQRIRDLLSGANAQVMELPIDVASLMTSKLILSELGSKDLSQYDLVLVPGALRANLEDLEAELAAPFYLGPVHFSDIPTVLEGLHADRLSKIVPADMLLEETLRDRTIRSFQKASKVPDKLPANTIIIGKGEGRTAIGTRFPPRVIAEIVDAPRKDVYSILLEAKRLVATGASLVDVGMIPNEDNPDFIRMIVPLLRRNLKVPVSVDTMRECDILAAADAGADLVLSICGSTLDLVPSIDRPAVLVPIELPGKERPRSSKDKLELLAEYFRSLEGYDIILDPLLEPLGLGFSDSVRAYVDLQLRIPDQPALMGVGNVIELADADSVGMNALLAAIASETGTSMLLTTENSPKTRGSVEELATACVMMFHANRKGIPPKNLGVNLLRYKEKTLREYPVKLPKVKVRASGKGGTGRIPADDLGFHITLRGRDIHAIYRSKEEQIDIIGRTADEIADELEERGIMPASRHAFYLGKELGKAETAMRVARSYVQDEPLFRRRDMGGPGTDD